MYLNLLNDEQKATFLALATKIVMADRKVLSEEFSLMNVIQSELGWEIKASGSELDGEIKYRVFDTPRARLIALLEIYLVAICDHVLPPEEIVILDDVREQLGFSKDEAEEVLAWAQRAAPLLLEGWKMIWDEDFGPQG